MKISVCIATYNGEPYLNEQISSILPQLGPDDEIIVSDDSSTDSTVKLIKSFADPRVVIYTNQKFGSPIFNFENALKYSSGDVIFLSDQDDIWHKDKVKQMMEALSTADIVVCDCTFINDKKEVILDSYFKVAGSSPGLIKNLKKNTYFGCCMAFHRSVLKKALPFPKDIPMHDIWLGFVGDLFFKTKFLDKPLTFYRKHNSNASIASDVVSNLSLLTKLKFRLNLIKYLPSLIFR